MKLRYVTKASREIDVPDCLSPKEMVEIIERNEENIDKIFKELDTFTVGRCDDVIYEVEFSLSSEENNYQPTIELTKDDSEEVIWNNIVKVIQE